MSNAYDEKNKRLFFYRGYETTQTDSNCWVIFKGDKYIDDAGSDKEAEKRIDEDINDGVKI